MKERLISVTALAVVVAACGGGSRTPAATRPASVPGLRGTLYSGQQASGYLTASDPRLNRNAVYNFFYYTATAGETVVLEVLSDQMDPYAVIQDFQGNALASDDDGGEGLNARLTYTFPSSGVYRLVATTYRENTYGPYTIRVNRVSAGGGGGGSTPGVRGSISRGEVRTGFLTANDPRLNRNAVYHAYLYTARAGETITVEVLSDQIDPYAVIQDAQGNALASDDDGGGGLNARLVYTFPAGGTYRIVATTYRENTYGPYTLRVY